MAGMAVIGAQARVEGWALAGLLVLGAETPDALAGAWQEVLAGGVEVVLLTPDAARHLADRVDGHAGAPLCAVLPA